MSRPQVFQVGHYWVWWCNANHEGYVSEEYTPATRDPWCVANAGARQHAELYHPAPDDAEQVQLP